MNRKVLVTAMLFLAVSMATTALVQAKPWTLRNNEKFESYDMVGTFSMLSILGSEHVYTPSIDDIQKLTINVNENNLWQTYTITIGANTYHLGTDFIYTGSSQWIFYQPIFTTGLLYPLGGFSQMHLLVDYMYTFLPASGIEGTLTMQAIGNEGGTNINSLSGTGDLQNVQIKATSEDSGGTTPPLFILNVHHFGIVSGWPD